MPERNMDVREWVDSLLREQGAKEAEIVEVCVDEDGDLAQRSVGFYRRNDGDA